MSARGGAVSRPAAVVTRGGTDEGRTPGHGREAQSANRLPAHTSGCPAPAVSKRVPPRPSGITLHGLPEALWRAGWRVWACTDAAQVSPSGPNSHRPLFTCSPWFRRETTQLLAAMHMHTRACPAHRCVCTHTTYRTPHLPTPRTHTHTTPGCRHAHTHTPAHTHSLKRTHLHTHHRCGATETGPFKPGTSHLQAGNCHQPHPPPTRTSTAHEPNPESVRK